MKDDYVVVYTVAQASAPAPRSPLASQLLLLPGTGQRLLLVLAHCYLYFTITDNILCYIPTGNLAVFITSLHIPASDKGDISENEWGGMVDQGQRMGDTHGPGTAARQGSTACRCPCSCPARSRQGTACRSLSPVVTASRRPETAARIFPERLA